MAASVKGTVVNAIYIPQARCVTITLKDHNGKVLKPIAIYEESFAFKPDQDVDSQMEQIALLLRKFKYPITIQYEENKQT